MLITIVPIQIFTRLSYLLVIHFALQFLRVRDFPHSFHEVFVLYILTFSSDGKHTWGRGLRCEMGVVWVGRGLRTCFRANIAQVCSIEVFREFDYCFIV